MGGYTTQYSMTLKKSVTRTNFNLESRIMILPWLSIIFIFEHPPIDSTRQDRTVRISEEKVRFKTSDSVILDASRMEKNDVYWYIVSLEMPLFSSIFGAITVLSLYGEYALRFFLPHGVFLSRDHGLGFRHQLM